MDWIFFWTMVLGYFAVAGILVPFFTKITYRQSLKNGKDPIPESGPYYRKHTEAEREELETQRRAMLAKEAMRSGVIAGIAWFVTVPIIIIGTLFILINKFIKKVSIDPEDKEFITAKEYRRAEEIVAKWQMQETAQFEKELDA